MARPIKRRTISQWNEELRRIRRIMEAIELEGAHDVILTADVVSRLDGGVLLLERWIASIKKREASR
jgi:hypothetical protein